MRQRQQFYQIFSLCVLISFILIIFSPSKPVRLISGFLEKSFSPLQKSVYTNLGLTLKDDKDELEILKNENLELKTQLVRLKTLEEDLQILESQLLESNPRPEKLLKASIIGSNISYPGLNPSEIVIDIGESEGVNPGKAVVYKNNLIGVTHKTARNRTIVILINNKNTSFTAQTLKTKALGVIKGGENGVNLTSVVLSEKLEKEDLVITKGDSDLDGKGFPPGLIVGKVHSIDKKPSALFQSASVTPLVDVSKLSAVFIMME